MGTLVCHLKAVMVNPVKGSLTNWCGTCLRAVLVPPQYAPVVTSGGLELICGECLDKQPDGADHVEDREAWMRENVRCSSCGGPLGEVINLVALQRLTTWQYPVASDFLARENGRAVAMCCDGCLDFQRRPIEAVEFRADGVVYHPVEDLAKI